MVSKELIIGLLIILVLISAVQAYQIGTLNEKIKGKISIGVSSVNSGTSAPNPAPESSTYQGMVGGC